MGFAYWKINVLSPDTFINMLWGEGNEGSKGNVCATGSSSTKVLLDNSVLVEPAQLVRSRGETTWCNLAHVFILNKQGSNIMGINEQKLQNIYTYPERAKKFTSIINGLFLKKKSKAEADSLGQAEFKPGLTTAAFDGWVQNLAQL